MCRAKLGAQCILKCPIEKRKRRRALAAAAAEAAAKGEPPPAEAAAAEGAAGGESPPEGLSRQLSLRESISSLDDSQDGDMEMGQENLGQCCRQHPCEPP